MRWSQLDDMVKVVLRVVLVFVALVAAGVLLIIFVRWRMTYHRWVIVNDTGAPITSGTFAIGPNYDRAIHFERSLGRIAPGDSTEFKGAPLDDAVLRVHALLASGDTLQIERYYYMDDPPNPIVMHLSRDTLAWVFVGYRDTLEFNPGTAVGTDWRLR